MTTLQRIFGQLIVSDERLSAQECQEIICDYAHLLDTDAPLPGCVTDASKLPHPKDTIKLAILTCMVTSGGDGFYYKLYLSNVINLNGSSQATRAHATEHMGKSLFMQDLSQ